MGGRLSITLSGFSVLISGDGLQPVEALLLELSGNLGSIGGMPPSDL